MLCSVFSKQHFFIHRSLARSSLRPILGCYFAIYGEIYLMWKYPEKRRANTQIMNYVSCFCLCGYKFIHLNEHFSFKTAELWMERHTALQPAAMECIDGNKYWTVTSAKANWNRNRIPAQGDSSPACWPSPPRWRNYWLRFDEWGERKDSFGIIKL